MECLSYVDLSHDYSKSIILTICHHITDTCICTIPPLNVCHLCQMCIKPQVPSPPLLLLLWEFGSDGVIMSSSSSLFPSSSLLVVLSLISYSPSSSLFSYSTSLLSAPPLSPPFAGNTYLKQEISKSKYFLIWNWIRSSKSCSSINSPMICYEEFWCLVWARPATPPRPTL